MKNIFLVILISFVGSIAQASVTNGSYECLTDNHEVMPMLISDQGLAFGFVGYEYSDDWRPLEGTIGDFQGVYKAERLGNSIVVSSESGNTQTKIFGRILVNEARTGVTLAVISTEVSRVNQSLEHTNHFYACTRR